MVEKNKVDLFQRVDELKDKIKEIRGCLWNRKNRKTNCTAWKENVGSGFLAKRGKLKDTTKFKFFKRKKRGMGKNSFPVWRGSCLKRTSGGRKRPWNRKRV